MTRRPLKAFFAGAMMLPAEWVGARQGDLLAFAASKADLERLLIEVGAPMWACTEVPKQARWWRGDGTPPGGTTWGKVIASGAIDPTRRSVYAAPMSLVKGAEVVEVVDRGTRPVARIGYDRKSGGLFAEVV